MNDVKEKFYLIRMPGGLSEKITPGEIEHSFRKFWNIAAHYPILNVVDITDKCSYIQAELAKEREVKAELIAALNRFLAYGNVSGHHEWEKNPYEQAREAIAKAKGETEGK